MTGARRKAMRGVLAIAVGAALLSGVPLGAGDRQDAAAGADACPAPASLGRVQVLVELADMPALRAYEAALASASAGEPAAREAAARAAERAQDQKVKEAQAAAARELAALGARELYRVRRSFNGISVVVDAHKLDALRGLPGVKAVYPRTTATAEAALVPAASAAGTSPAASRTAAPGAGLRAYVDPATGRLTEAPTEAQVRELDKGLGELASRSSEGLEAATQADGTQVVDLKGRFRSLSTATVSATGALRLECVDAGARRAPTVPTSSPEPEKQ
jgi:hypothetical protein